MEIHKSLRYNNAGRTFVPYGDGFERSAHRISFLYPYSSLHCQHAPVQQDKKDNASTSAVRRERIDCDERLHLNIEKLYRIVAQFNLTLTDADVQSISDTQCDADLLLIRVKKLIARSVLTAQIKCPENSEDSSGDSITRSKSDGEKSQPSKEKQHKRKQTGKLWKVFTMCVPGVEDIVDNATDMNACINNSGDNLASRSNTGENKRQRLELRSSIPTDKKKRVMHVTWNIPVADNMSSSCNKTAEDVATRVQNNTDGNGGDMESEKEVLTDPTCITTHDLYTEQKNPSHERDEYQDASHETKKPKLGFVQKLKAMILGKPKDLTNETKLNVTTKVNDQGDLKLLKLSNLSEGVNYSEELALNDDDIENAERQRADGMSREEADMCISRRDPKFTVKPPKDPAVVVEKENYDNKVKETTPTATRNLLFIRHGQYNLKGTTNDSQRYLTEIGREQVDLTGKRLKELGHPYTRMVHSNMTRARESAEIIHKQLPHLPMTIDEMLQEGAPTPPEPPIGNWRTESEFYKEGARIEAAFRTHFHRATPEQEKDSYEVYVCHANVIRFFICRALQLPPEAWLRMSMYNGSVTWFTIRPSGRVSLKYHGDAGHMPPRLLTTS